MTAARNCNTLFVSALSVYVLRSNKTGNGELLGFSTQMKDGLSADFRETHKGLTTLLPDISCRFLPKLQKNIETTD
jgi:hypothetical protein